MLSKIKITLVMLSSLAVASPALASDLSGADTAWLLTATALVLFMTLPGLSLFYGGLVRVRNVLSVLMQCFALAALMSLVWFVAGYTLAFGSGGVEQGPWLGDLGNLFLAGISLDGVNGSIPDSLFVMFQMTFAIITPALIVGGFAERMRFSAMLVFCVAWVLLVYAPICHWVWGGMLWVGWFGFNAGSAVAADGSAAMAMLVTHLSAACGSLAWMTMEWLRHGKPSVLGIVTGMVAGLGTITPASGSVGPAAAVVIGLTAGVVCYSATIALKNRLKIDDSLDVFPVHGVGGALGTLLAGIFCSPNLGIFSGNGFSDGIDSIAGQLGVQATGVAATFIYTAVVSWVLFKVVDGLIGLRVDADEETIGLDLVLHDERGYDL